MLHVGCDLILRYVVVCHGYDATLHHPWCIIVLCRVECLVLSGHSLLALSHILPGELPLSLYRKVRLFGHAFDIVLSREYGALHH